MLSESTAALLLVLVLLAFVVRQVRRARQTCLPLPPGPPRLPIIGNALDIPTKYMEVKFDELSRRYGDLVYLDAAGQPMLILGTHEAAVELLDKRSAIYSDRVYSPMVELAGLDWVITMIHYGPWWRRHRRALHQFFNPNAVVQFRALQRTQVNRFLVRLLDRPEAFKGHIKHLFAATIMRIAYGVEVKDEHDEYVSLAEEGLAAFTVLLVPGKYLVELFPVLRHLPSWLPGVRFKKDAAWGRAAARRLREIPWTRTVEAMRQGVAEPSMTRTLMEHISGLEGQEAAEEEEVARNTVAAAYGAGADTTLSAIQAFFLVMASFPDAQRKAQAELDAVVGPHRLPDFSDEAQLPYVSAVIKECLRWHTIVPLGIPHRLIQDDEYRGYRIPKGTLVTPNIWAYSRDETHYPNSREFLPERFLADGKIDRSVLDPAEYAFGFGRRVCPGRHFAEASLFLILSSVLHTLSISPPLDDRGNPIKLEGKATSGIISWVMFQARLSEALAHEEIVVIRSPSTASSSHAGHGQRFSSVRVNNEDLMLWDHYPSLKIPGIIPVIPSLQCCTSGAQLKGTVQMGPPTRPAVAVGVVRLGGREKRPGPRCRGRTLATSVARNQGVLGLPPEGVASPRAVLFEWSSRLFWAS